MGNFAKLIKKVELATYRIYTAYTRSQYAKHDLNRKLYHMDIKPISSKNFASIKKFYSSWGIKVDKKWFDLFNTLNSNKQNKIEYYIPHNIYYSEIDSYYSEVRKAGFYDNKILYDVYFHDIKQPNTIIRKYLPDNGGGKEPIYLDKQYNIISREDAIKICESHEQLIIKPATYSSGGSGIKFYDSKKDHSIASLLDSSNILVVQEVIKQHERLNYLHVDSVNTIRIITLILNNKVNILSCVLRMGQGGAKVDNASSGGIFCGIEASGQLKNIAYDCNGVIYNKHPQGAIFEEVVIPNFEKCKELVKKLAPRISSITKLCSWDIAIDCTGNPILIEANFSFGEVDFHQMCNGPIFGDLTENILTEVFKK